MRATAAILTLLFWPIAGCPGNGSDDDDIAIRDDDATEPSCVEAMEASLQEVAASPDVVVDWSGFTEDTDGNAVNPAALDNLSVLGFEIAVDETIAGLCEDTLTQADVTLGGFYEDIDGTTTFVIDTTDMAGAMLTVMVSSGGGATSTALATVVEGATNEVIYIENGGVIPSEE